MGGPRVAASQDAGPRGQRDRGRKGSGLRCCWAAVACWAIRRRETEIGRAEGGTRPREKERRRVCAVDLGQLTGLAGLSDRKQREEGREVKKFLSFFLKLIFKSKFKSNSNIVSIYFSR